MLDKNSGNLCLYVEVRRGLDRPRLWAWKIYAGEYEYPVDESHPIFSSPVAAMNVGVTVRNYMYFKHGACLKFLH